MGLELGIIGLPNVGKSTLFRAISSAPAEIANYPFCTIDPNIGIVEVPDPRIERLAKIFGSQKIVRNFVKFVDIAGLVKGASKGEGLGSKFLGNIREVDAIIHIVRGFDDDNIIHVNQKVDPANDVDIIKTELILSDLEVLEKRTEKLKKDSKGNPKQTSLVNFCEKLQKHLSDFNMASLFSGESDEEKKLFKELNLLTAKPFFYLLNVAEEDLKQVNKHEKVMEKIAKKDQVDLLKVCCALESELSELDNEYKKNFLQEFGIEQTGLEKIIPEGFKLLEQVSFFTAGPKETNAWNLKKNSKAPQAAGKIHTDMERGFIRVEVYHFDDIDTLGSEVAIKNAGKLRIEGQDYMVQDGDILHVRFNV